MLRKFREILKNKQRGAIMVFFAILVPLFLGVIGLAVDAGFLYMQKAKLQDVADATALAGAGHLKDENREEQVEKAIVAFAGANGYGKDKDEAVSSKFPELGDKVDDSNVTLEENAAWKIAYAIDTGMEDNDAKNGELRDHVRVVILKRVPTFFIRLLFPEQKEVVVKAVAAAEYVKGEETPPASSGAPGLIAYAGALEFHSSEIYGKNGKGLETDLYAGGAWIPDNNLHLYGSYYAPSEWPGVKLQGDKDKNKYKPFWWENYGTDEQKKEIKKVKNQVESLHEACESFMRNVNIEAYKNGEGNKVYIDRFRILPENVVINPSKEYDVYIDAGNMTMDPNQDQYGDWRSIICNRYLQGIKKINNLYVTSTSTASAILHTEGITYNNVYLNVGAFIEGKNNYFNGVIYNQNQVSFMGDCNHYTRVLANNIRIGYGYHFDTEREGAASKNWKCFFGGGSSSDSGSSGSGAEKAHVRLVI